MQSSAGEESHSQTGLTIADLDPKELEEHLSAAAQGDFLAIESLIDNKYDISAAFGSILCAAAYRGHLKLIKLLISKGADVNAHEDGETALLAAALAAQAEAIQLLIENGADVHAKTSEGVSALHQAVMTNQASKTDAVLEIIDQLLKEGLGIEIPNEESRTTLHEISFNGRVDLMDGFIAKGANLNVKDKWQDTSLDRACLNDYIDVVKSLISYEVEINPREV